MNINNWIVGCYIFFTCIWILLIFYLGIYKNLASYFLIIPPILFFISCFSLDDEKVTSVISVTSSSFLQIGLLASVALLGWFKNETGSIHRNAHVILVSMCFTLLSHLDVFVNETWLKFQCHLCVMCETFSITLLLYVLLDFFFSIRKNYN